MEDSPCKQINNNIKINQRLLSASSKCQSQGQYDDESAYIYIHISAAEALTIVRPYTRIAYLGRVPKAELTFNQPQLLPACLNYLLKSWSSRNEI